MSELVQDLRFALRQMARKPGITSFAVLSLRTASSGSPWSPPATWCSTPPSTVPSSASPLVLATVSFLANLLPAQRATEVDPVVALRYD